MDWVGNGLDDANNRAIQSLVVSQHDTSGAAVEVSTIIGVYLSAGSSGRTKTVFAIGIPFPVYPFSSASSLAINRHLPHA
jgi:hypothetical protein